jgi:trigger factor
MADATATTEPGTYDVSIEEVSGARKRLTITVPAEMIGERITDSMGTLATQTTLPGFRKGRAPKALLERRFGTSVRQETKNQIVADGYAKAIEQHSIKPVGEPEPVEKLDELELEIGKPFTFSVEVEVVPEFDLPELDKIEVKKPVIDVTEEHIELEMTRQCTQAGEVHAVDADFAEGDRLVGPGTAIKGDDEEPFFTHDNVDVIVPGDADGGRGHVLGLIIEGLAGMLQGKRVGDTLTFETTGPSSHELEEIRDQKLAIEMTIREAQRIEPATADAVVAQYGLGSAEILREQIKLALEQRRDEEQRSAMREQVCANLIESVDFELPAKLSDAQASRMLERQRLELMYRGGLSVDEVETRLAEMRAETQEQSRRRLKLSFLLHRLAENFGVEVSDQEINGRIAAIAAQRGMRPEKLRSDLLQSGGIGFIAQQIREHKAADRVIDQAKVVEVSAEEWNELVFAQRAEQKGTAAGAKSATGSKKKTTKKTTKKKTTKKKTAKKSGD